jgi:hypothetical protein
VTGEVTEDFRSEILGFLGASPNYQDLYKKALVDRDYNRTEREIAEAVEKARQASEALRSLAQDLEGFNLASYTALRGRFGLPDLRDFCLAALPRLGGSILPDGEFYRIHVPSRLGSSKIDRVYLAATFDRQLAMRRKHATLLGIGHPLIDALLDELQRDDLPGTLADLRRDDSIEPFVRVHCLAHVVHEDGKASRLPRAADLRLNGSWQPVDESDDKVLLAALKGANRSRARGTPLPAARELASLYKTVAAFWEGEIRAEESDVLSVRLILIGAALCN